jgi:hypothetical protein
MGIRLHRAFENASTREEIVSAVDEMALNGEISSAEVAVLKEQIGQTLENTVAGEWFDGSWEELHCERTIILPDGKSKRPDRVMTRDKEAVVIDYKLGEESTLYNEQIVNYMQQLQKMGYASVRGYIWYVYTNKIIEV